MENGNWLGFTFDTIDFIVMLKHLFIYSFSILAILCSCGSKEKAVQGVTLNYPSLEMEEGQQAQLVATILPEGTTGVQYPIFLHAHI